MIVIHNASKKVAEMIEADIRSHHLYRDSVTIRPNHVNNENYEIAFETGLPVIIKYYNLDKAFRLSLGGYLSEEILSYQYSSVEVI